MSEDTVHRIIETAKSFCRAEGLLPRGGLVVAAVSGGPDSMALVSILTALAPEWGYGVVVGHLDHALRVDSGEDRALVERTAAAAGLSFYTERVDVLALAEQTGDTIEEAARKARYRFLARLADRVGGSAVATGHTRTDQAETVLMRILRGTGIRGMAGIPVKRGRIVRPLLCLDREETLAYCEAAGIPFRRDESNQDERFFRNRIRRELLPLLEARYHAGVTRSLLRLSQNAAEVVRDIRRRTEPLLRESVRQEGPAEWTLALPPLRELDETSLFVLLGDLFAEWMGSDMDFTRVHYEGLFHLVRDVGVSGKRLSLPGIEAKREHDALVFRLEGTGEAARRLASDSRVEPIIAVRSGEPGAGAAGPRNGAGGPPAGVVPLALPGETRSGGLRVRTEILERSEVGAPSLRSTSGVAYLSLARLNPPLVLRPPRPGDRMRPFGMSGSKKLSDIFIDRKIPGRERSRSLVLADQDEIVWLVGVATAEKCRVDDATEAVLRITIDKERHDATSS